MLLLLALLIANPMLEAHNQLRARFGSPPLQWSATLAQSAQRWADTLARDGRFTPQPGSDLGQNLFELTGGQAEPAQVVNAWASEQQFYNPADGSCSARCGHFTQVVWRDTKEVGCGVAHSGKREVWVCHYSPHGNNVGEKAY